MGRKICQSGEMSHSCRQEHLRVLQLNHPDPESVPCAVTVGLQSAQAFEMNQKCMSFWTTVSSCLQTCKDEQCRSNSLPVEALFVVESHWGFFLFLIYYYLRRLSWGLLQRYGNALQLLTVCSCWAAVSVALCIYFSTNWFRVLFHVHAPAVVLWALFWVSCCISLTAHKQIWPFISNGSVLKNDCGADQTSQRQNNFCLQEELN